MNKLSALAVLLLGASASAADKTIVVAVLDTGIDKDNPHLCKKGHFDFVRNKPGTYDMHGHGTHIAGIIAKEAGDDNYCIVSLKYYSDANTSKMNINNTIKALRYAIDLKVDFINYSGGGSNSNPEEKKLIEEAQKKGIVVVAAAGNEHEDLDKDCNYFPACYNTNVIMVGNLEVNREGPKLIKDPGWRALAEAANMVEELSKVKSKPSDTSNFGKRVTVWEEGTNVMSTLPGGRTGPMSGTSQATAVHTGKLVKAKLTH